MLKKSSVAISSKLGLTYTNNNSKVNNMPPKVKYIPFLNIEELGANIQKDEITKKSNPSPKKILRKNKGSDVLALCKCCSLSST